MLSDEDLNSRGELDTLIKLTPIPAAIHSHRDVVAFVLAVVDIERKLDSKSLTPSRQGRLKNSS